MNFVAAPMTSNENRRLEAVKKLGVTETNQKDLFYVYGELSIAISDFSIAASSVIDLDTQHLISICGPQEIEKMMGENPKFPRSKSPCAYTILSSKPLIVLNCHDHEVFKNADSVSSGMVTAYAGFPIINKDNYVYGTLCLFDQNEKNLDNKQIKLIEKLVARLAHQLDTQMEQKEITSLKISDAITHFVEKIPDASLSTFKTFILLCSGMEVEEKLATELFKNNLCLISSNSDVKLTSEGENLQFKMGLQTKVLNKIKIEGVEAEELVSDMLAKLETL